MIKHCKNRYQVSSCSQIEEQLDTWYRVKVLKGTNSIPSIELLPKCSPTRYLVSSWAVFTHEYNPARYQVSSWATFTHKSSPTRYEVSSWATFTHKYSPTRYPVSRWVVFTNECRPTRYQVIPSIELGCF